jgi:hypothetical protein
MFESNLKKNISHESFITIIRLTKSNSTYIRKEFFHQEVLNCQKS